jgi:hypothetical protein
MPSRWGRVFSCASCGCRVAICKRCDRGHLYCGRECRQQARRAQMRVAGKNHRMKTSALAHGALRQKRYRERRRGKIVTHHSVVGKAFSVAELRVHSADKGSAMEPTCCCVCGCRRP